MKTKLLSLLLAISFMVGILPVAMVSAETTATTPTPAVSSPTATTSPTDATSPNFDLVSLSVKLCENNTTQDYSVVLTATKGGKPVYATTNDSGTPALVTGSAVPNNRYVKFEYPQNGLPTITFMNAKLRSSGNVLDLSFFDAPVKIVIAGDSTIESTSKNGIYRASYGDVTIVGPKKLTMNCYNSAIAFTGDPYANSLTLKDLKLKATAYANTDGHTIQIPAGNFTVDSCNIELINRAGVCVYLGHGNVSGYGSAMISKSVFSANSQNTAFKLSGNLSIYDSNAEFSSDTQALLCGRNLSLNSSTLYMTGRSNVKETVDVRGDFTLRTSNAEIIGTRFAIFSSTTLPRTLGEYTALAGITKNTTATFQEDLIGAYQYYYAESLEQATEPTTPTVSATDPTETDSTGTEPTGTEPTGTDPTGTDPTETDPTGTDPTETDPTETEFTEPTLAPPTEPDSPEPTTTLATLPTPTRPVNSTAKKSGTMFWILAALMVIGACSAATMAVMMFRRSAEEDDEDELDEISKENANLEYEEDIDENPKKFSIEKLKMFFVKKPKEDNPEEDIPVETQENPEEDIPVEAQENPEEETEEKTEEEIEEEPKKFSWEKFRIFFAKKNKEDHLEEDHLEEDHLEEDSPAEIEETSHEDPLEEIFEEPEQEFTEADLEDIIREFHEDPVEESQEEIEEESVEDIVEKPKKFSMEKVKKFFIKVIEETTKDDNGEDTEDQ